MKLSACFQACSATSRPLSVPTRSARPKWIPPYRRDIPAWFAASVKVAQERVTSCLGVNPGSVLELPAENVTESPNLSLWVNSLRISAPAALKVLWPEMDSRKGGVANAG